MNGKPGARERALELLAQMDLVEKIGQMSQLNAGHHGLEDAIRAGRVGSILNEVLDSGVLKVGTTGDFNPMSFKDPETKEYKGHQIDAAKQLAADMGVELEFVPTDWKTLINGVVPGNLYSDKES